MFQGHKLKNYKPVSDNIKLIPDHPYADYVRGAYLFNSPGILKDYSKNRFHATLGTGSPSQSRMANPYMNGAGLFYDASGSGEHHTLGSWNPFRVDESFFIVAGCRFNTIGANDRRVISKANGSAGSNHDLMLGVIGSSGTYDRARVRINVGATTSTIINDDLPAGQINTGKYVMLCLAYDKTSNFGYVGSITEDVGLAYKSAVLTSGSLIQSTKELAIGRNGSDTTAGNRFDGDLFYCYLVAHPVASNSSIFQSFLWDMWEDPLQMFYIPRPYFVVPTTGTVHNIGNGSFNFSAQTLTVNDKRIETIGNASFSYTAQILTINDAQDELLANASFNFTAQTFDINDAQNEIIGVASFSTTPQTFSVTTGTVEEILIGSFNYTAQTVTDKQDTNITPVIASFNFSAGNFSVTGEGFDNISRDIRNEIRDKVAFDLIDFDRDYV